MEDREAEACQSCDAQGVPLKLYGMARYFPDDRKKLLCDLCASTSAGIALEYPEQYKGQVALLQTICFVGNEILKALKDV